MKKFLIIVILLVIGLSAWISLFPEQKETYYCIDCGEEYVNGVLWQSDIFEKTSEYHYGKPVFLKRTSSPTNPTDFNEMNLVWNILWITGISLLLAGLISLLPHKKKIVIINEVNHEVKDQ